MNVPVKYCNETALCKYSTCVFKYGNVTLKYFKNVGNSETFWCSGNNNA